MSFSPNAPYDALEPNPFQKKKGFSVPGWFALIVVVLCAGAFVAFTWPLHKAHSLLATEYEALAKKASAVNTELGDTKKKLEETEKERAKLSEAAQAVASKNDKEKSALGGLKEKLATALEPWLSKSVLDLAETEGEVTLSMPSQFLFRPHSLALTSQGAKALCLATGTAKDDPTFTLTARGHMSTDEVLSPSLKADYPTAWALSAAQAASVVEVAWESCGWDPVRISAAAQQAQRPLTEDTSSRLDKNARIDLVFRLTQTE